MNNPAHNANCDLIALAENFLLNLKDGPLAVAVSGGCDSMAILDLLSKANSQRRELFCYTVDHQLRNEAKLEAEFVADFCASRHITHKTLIWNENKPSSGIQNAARWARYKLLYHACQDVGAIGLVTGHNLDDQVETVLMRLRRDKTGEGAGLSGMAPAALFFENMWVLRPLLSVRKQQLKDYLLSCSIDWKEDPSNTDETYERVRVRNQTAQDVGEKDIGLFAQNRQSISNMAAEYIQQHCKTKNGFVFELKVSEHKRQVLEKVLEALVHSIGGRDRSLRRNDITALYDFATANNDVRKTMGRVVLDKTGTVIQLYRENRGFNDCRIHGGDDVTWDGRYLIKNLHEKMTCALKQNTNQLGCPPLVKWLGDEDWSAALECELLSIKPVLNKYDQVLSVFDLKLANSIARLIGRSEFLLPFDNAKVQNQQQ